MLFDKTGTLTRGRHVVTGVTGVGIEPDEVLRLAGGIEADSEHPLARAIATAARAHGDVATATATDFTAITGRGVEATIDGHRYAIGGPVLLRERSLDIPAALRADIHTWTARGAAVLHLVRDGEIIGALTLEDEIRPEARQAVADLHAAGIESVVMITGDARQVADAPALAHADVGLAIGAGTDVAIESAGVVLAGNDPRSVIGVIRLSKASYRKMRQNLAWAAGYRWSPANNGTRSVASTIRPRR